MEKYDGSKLNPLFWSEISSSYMIRDIFANHKEVAKKFVHKFLNLDTEGIADNNIDIKREKRYEGKGHIDLFLSFKKNKVINILIEVKVHDYASATKGQIKTYYDAALEEVNKEAEVYFIYLTQFNKDNFSSDNSMLLPPTIEEFEDAQKVLAENRSKLQHVSWEEFHDFVKEFKEYFSSEEKLILDLQEQWITQKCQYDKNINTLEVGKRDLFEYFSDIKINLIKDLPFGKVVNNKFVIDLSTCDRVEMDKVLVAIMVLASSSKIERNKMKNNEETLTGAREFLASLAQNENDWNMLSFYSSLFNFINSTDYLLFYGTGAKGFSIVVNVTGKGRISLCTLWRNKKIEFVLKR